MPLVQSEPESPSAYAQVWQADERTSGAERRTDLACTVRGAALPIRTQSVHARLTTVRPDLFLFDAMRRGKIFFAYPWPVWHK